MRLQFTNAGLGKCQVCGAKASGLAFVWHCPLNSLRHIDNRTGNYLNKDFDLFVFFHTIRVGKRGGLHHLVFVNVDYFISVLIWPIITYKTSTIIYLYISCCFISPESTRFSSFYILLLDFGMDASLALNACVLLIPTCGINQNSSISVGKSTEL